MFLDAMGLENGPALTNLLHLISPWSRPRPEQLVP
jgi:hypothetical protein